MIETKIDYRNLLFQVYQDDKPVENPLPSEVQRAVIQMIAEDICDELNRQLKHQLSDSPPGLKELILH